MLTAASTDSESSASLTRTSLVAGAVSGGVALLAVVAMLAGFKLKSGKGSQVHPQPAVDSQAPNGSGDNPHSGDIVQTSFSSSIAVDKDNKAMGRIEKRFEGSNTPIREPEVLMAGACFMQEMLGKGAFGEVHKGLAFLKESGKSAPTAKPVAIKLLPEGKESDEHKADMLAEAYVAAQFVHSNVVSFVGIIDEPGARYGIVFELCNFGSLDKLVELELVDRSTNVRARRISTKAALMIAAQVADGMNYLGEVHNFVHRDLACRNVLVSGKNLLSLSSSLLREDGDPTSMVCQVSDFGLSREMKNSEAVDDYYTMVGGKVPVRWSAPESLKAGLYTVATDVWAYGITLYELWVPGEKPYDRLPNLSGPGTDVAVLAAIVTGTICPNPFGDQNNGDGYYPPGMYDRLMRSCWNSDSWSRPTFAKLSTWAKQQLNRLNAESTRAGIQSIPAPNFPVRGGSVRGSKGVRASAALTTASVMPNQSAFPPTPAWSTTSPLADFTQNIESQIKDRYLAVLKETAAAERNAFANDPAIDAQALQELGDAENALLDAEADLFALNFMSDFEPTVDGMIELNASFTRSFAVAADAQKLVTEFKEKIMAAAPAAVREAAAALTAGSEVPVTVRLAQRLKVAKAQRATVVAEVAIAERKNRPKFLFNGRVNSPPKKSELPPLASNQRSHIPPPSQLGMPIMPVHAGSDAAKSAAAPKEEYEYMKVKVGRLSKRLHETTKLLKRQEGAAADSVLEYHEISVAGVAKSEEEAKAEQFAALQAKLKMRAGRRSSQALPKPSADASTDGYLNPNLT